MNVLLAFVIFTGDRLATATRPSASRSSAVQPGSPAGGGRPRSRATRSSRSTASVYRVLDRRRPLTGDLRTHAGETVTLGVEPSPTARSSDVPVTLRTPSQIDDQQGRARDRATSRSSSSSDVSPTRPRRGDPGSARSGRSTRSALIVGGLGKPRRLDRQRPDRGAAGPGPGRDRHPDRRHLLAARADRSRSTWPGILSANLAVVNILPFPPLDGGRMLMITLKRFFGARISLRAEQLTYMVGFVFLFAFLIWITGFDIVAQARRRHVTAMSSPGQPAAAPSPDRQRRRRRRPRRVGATRSSSSR